MARLMGTPKIERMQDILDRGNATWAGAEINFRVKPSPGEDWSPDFSAGCLIDGEPALVPEAMNQLRKWDKEPANSFYCYAPVGYLRDGAKLTLQVRDRDKKGRPTQKIVWEGQFLVHLQGDEYLLQPIVSLSPGTLDELQTLPGIGPKTAEAIIAYREKHGPFTSVDQLAAVPMLGRDKIDVLRDLVKP